MLFICLQYTGQTWYTEEPDLTPCFLQTVLVWSPFAFLLLFGPLDIYFSRTSKYSNIPWGFQNVGRLSLIILLVAHALVDMAVGATWHSKTKMIPVYWVTPSFRIVMFVSISTNLKIYKLAYYAFFITDVDHISYVATSQTRNYFIWSDDDVLAALHRSGHTSIPI